MAPKLRFPEKQLPLFASRYQYPLEENTVIDLRPTIVKRGFMKKDELRIIAHWKARRSAGRMENNQEEYINEITAFSFSAKTE